MYHWPDLEAEPDTSVRFRPIWIAASRGSAWYRD